MNKFLLLITFSIFCFTTTFAQISVKFFRVLPTDQTARITDPVIDQNGDKCALIKVVTTQQGMLFEGGMLGIMKRLWKNGEYWVYVPHGAKRLTIKYDKLGVLRNYIYTEAIQKSTVYEMVLTTDIVTTVIKNREIKSQWVVITTEPEGADVYIDDKHSGQTPFQQEFKEGKHTYRISKDLFHPEVGQFDLISDEGKKKMTYQLKPNYGFINIKSFPEDNAAIFIDNTDINKKTSYKTDKIKSGKYSISLSHKWYENAKKEIEVKDNKTTEVNISMIPKFAEVTINASNDADIYIDNKLEGNGNLSKRLMAGTYSVEVKKSMYHIIKETIEIKAGEPFSKEYKLQPAFAGITIETKPENGAEVSVDGNPTGKITPCTLEQLSSGKHIVSLRREWYEPKKFRITVEDGKNQNIIQDLTPTFVEVSVTTNPVADIYIDMQKVGNNTYTGRVKTGIHTFEARKDKYTSDNKKEEIILDNAYNINLSLKPKYGTLKIVSEPFDAIITLNGKESGTTPKTFYNLLVGEYVIVINKHGFAPYSKTITLNEGKTQSINEKLLSGKEITINSTPQGAKLYINNNYKGITPYTSELSFGQHNVKLCKDEFQDIDKKIDIKENVDNVNLNLISKKINIKILSNPSGAEIWINNEYSGITPATLDLPAGKINLTLSKNKFHSFTKSIQINKNTPNIDYKLKLKGKYYTSKSEAMLMSLIWPGLGSYKIEKKSSTTLIKVGGLISGILAIGAIPMAIAGSPETEKVWPVYLGIHGSMIIIDWLVISGLKNKNMEKYYSQSIKPGVNLHYDNITGKQNLMFSMRYNIKYR